MKNSKRRFFCILIVLVLLAGISIFVVTAMNRSDELDLSIFEHSTPLIISSSLVDVNMELTGTDKENGILRWRTINSTNYQIYFGSYYVLEFLHNGDWFVIPLNEGFAFTLDLNILPSGQALDSHANIIRFYYPFPRAELYRIRRRLYTDIYHYYHDLVMEFQWW